MFNKRILPLVFILVLLAACQQGPTPPIPPGTPGPVIGPTGEPGRVLKPTPTPARLSALNFIGTTDEPLQVIVSQPADGAEDVTVAHDKLRIVAQFNHPVVPLVSVDNQRQLPQPLVIDPPVKGEGEWLNTSTYVFKPGQDLEPSTRYTVSVTPGLKDVMGGVLTSYAWSFTSARPDIAATYPAHNAQFVGVTLPITVTFNQAVDRPSAESRFSVRPAIEPATRPALPGRFEWDGFVMKFIPAQPLAYDTAYVAEVKAGVKSANGKAEMARSRSWGFRTVKQLGVAETRPKDGEQGSKAIREGFRIVFTAPVNPDSLKVTISPTITNQSIYWEGRDNTIAHVNGGWLASRAYTVTISADTLSRYGDRLGQNVIVRFSAAPLDPAFHLNVPGMMGMYDAGLRPVVYATFTNLDSIDYRLYLVNRADFLRLVGRNRYQFWEKYRPRDTDKIREWTISPQAEIDATRVISTSLVEGGGLLDPGVYYLEATSKAAVRRSPNENRHILVVSETNLAFKRTETEALVWATGLATGKPVPNLPLTLFGPNGEILASGQTDQDGVFRAKFSRQDPWEAIHVLSEADGRIVAVVGSDWANGIYPYEFNLPTQPMRQEFYANLYTDRAIYRPGQTVYFKGILRRDDDARYLLPDGVESVPVTVRDDQGKAIFKRDMPLSRFGTFHGEIELSPAASLGQYNISIQIGEEGPGQPPPFYSGVSFTVAAYRRPEFQVEVKTDKSEYFQGETIKVDANATYFFGSPVADAKVQWRLLSDDYFFTLPIPSLPGGRPKGGWDFTDYDVATDRRRIRRGEVVREGKGTTDAQGQFSFTVPADLADFPLSQNFTIDVEIVDVNNQSVSSRTTVIVHKGRYYIGLRPQRYVGTVGEEQGVDLITVDTQGEAVPGQALTVSFYEHKWYSVREKREDGRFYWTSAYTDTLVAKTDVTTDDKGAAVARFTPKVGGVYRIIAEGTPPSSPPLRGGPGGVEGQGGMKGQGEVRSATYLWVAGRDFVNWRMENNDRIDLVADKKEYAPGETAEILIPAPFKGAEALLTVERGGIREVRRLSLPGNSETIKLPIQSDYAPNVFVSVMLVKGRGPETSHRAAQGGATTNQSLPRDDLFTSHRAAQGGATTNQSLPRDDLFSPVPQFKLGYTNLNVSVRERLLNVVVKPDRLTATPGDTVNYTVEATDFNGKPVQAEFSVALVDKAIQSLAAETAQSPQQAFYGQRGLGVNTAATLVRSIDRINQTLTPEAKGGGGGALGAEPVRREFRETAYWNAAVTTDETGKAQFKVTLPDNLTTWNLTARGVTVETLVGDGKVDILSTKMLLIVPATPRFFVAGDRALVGATVHNNTDQALTTDVSLSGTGIDLAGPAQQSVSIPARGKTLVSWDVIVNAPTSLTQVGGPAGVRLKFEARGGNLQDAIELPALPVRFWSTPETVATAGQVDTRIIEQIKLPQTPSFPPLSGGGQGGVGNLTIQINPSLAAASRESLYFLESFDYECSEQTVSKFFPNVATYRALKQLGLERESLRQGLEVNVSKELQRLYALQKPDGGWGWWLADESNPFTTAYALLGLHEAKVAGFAVDDGSMQRAMQFLQQFLDKPVDVKQGYPANQRAFILFALAEAGRGDLGRTVRLYDDRANLANYGKALLMMTLARLEGVDKPRVKTLSADLVGTAVLSATGAHWEEAKVDYWTMNTNTRSTAMVVMALSRVDPKNAVLPNAVRWLMVARKEGHWETTQETAWSVLALTDYMVATGELKGQYTYQVSLNTRLVGDGQVSADNIDQTKTITIAVKDMLVDTANELAINRSGGDGRLYYSATLKYYLPTEHIPPLSKGIVVGRQYLGVDQSTLKPTGQPIEGARTGEYVQVKLTLVAPNDLHYLVLEDPLPAGFEAVDRSLKTASAAAQGPELRQGGRGAGEQGSEEDAWERPYWSYWAHSEVRDDRVAAFATYLAKGTYEYTYLMRASVAGDFRTLPATAWEMYFPEVFGRSAGVVFSVR